MTSGLSHLLIVRLPRAVPYSFFKGSQIRTNITFFNERVRHGIFFNVSISSGPEKPCFVRGRGVAALSTRVTPRGGGRSLGLVSRSLAQAVFLEPESDLYVRRSEDCNKM
jgi:hypothetical protein